MYQYVYLKIILQKERERERERETNIYFRLIVLRIHRVTRVILSLLSFVISINQKQIVEIWESSIAVRCCIGMYLQKLSISCWDQKEYLCNGNSEEKYHLTHKHPRHHLQHLSSVAFHSKWNHSSQEEFSYHWTASSNS